MTADTLIFIIYTFLGGILLAFLSSLLSKALYGSLINGLIKNDAADEISAKTLDELSLKSNKLLLFALKHNKSLKKLVFVTDENRYYLPTQNRLKAERLYLKEKTSLLTILIIIVLIIAVHLLCDRVIPFIMN